MGDNRPDIGAPRCGLFIGRDRFDPMIGSTRSSSSGTPYSRPEPSSSTKLTVRVLEHERPMDCDFVVHSQCFLVDTQT